jgi:hypothetical protein
VLPGAGIEPVGVRVQVKGDLRTNHCAIVQPLRYRGPHGLPSHRLPVPAEPEVDPLLVPLWRSGIDIRRREYFSLLCCFVFTEDILVGFCPICWFIQKMMH